MELDKLKKYNSSNIFSVKQSLFELLDLSSETIKKYHKSLQYYKAIDNISEINEGYYIRWINPNTKKLMNGALVCDVEITEDDILVNCKTLNNRFITISYNNNILFEKLSDEDLLLINVVDSFNK